MRSLVTFVLLAFPVSSLGSGAIRHDVPEERYRELARLPDYQSAALLLDAGKPEASAVLVANRWALTAGHVTEALSAPDALTVRIGDVTFSVERIIRHPEYRPKGLGHGVDLALLRLSQDVPGVRPARRYTGASEQGKVGTTVGFGVFGTASSVITDPQPAGTKRAGSNSIDQIGGWIDGRELPDNFLIADFDAPGDPTRNRIGDAVPLELEYLPLGGDSGAGLFIDSGDGVRLAGIFSASTPRIPDGIEDGLYGSLFYWVRVSLYNDWIDAVLEGE